jgi:hypothetical protein
MLYLHDDYVKRINNLHKAASLHRGLFLPRIFRNLGTAYGHSGFKEQAIDYTTEAFMLDDDSAKYYFHLALIEDMNGSFENGIDFLKKSYAIDSTDPSVIRLIAQEYLYLDQFKESLKYYKKYEERLKTLNKPFGGITILTIGYAYWVKGFNEEADYYLNTGLKFHNELLKLGRSRGTLYSLSGYYAFRGDKDKAYEYLSLVNRRQRMPLYYIKNYKYNPLFDNIRDEPEFQQFLRDVEAKYQAEHERVGKWLEENGML